MELEEVLLVLLLQQHDAVLQQHHVEVDGLDAAGVAQLPGQRAVVHQAVAGQVQVLGERERGGGKRHVYQKSKMIFVAF